MRIQKNPRVQPETQKKLLRLGLLAAIFGTACIAGILSFVLVRQFALSRYALSGGVGPLFQSNPSRQSTPGAETSGTPLPGGNPSVPDIEPSMPAWDGVGRVTVLLMGLDFRDWESGSGASRSDTMILLTLDPLARTAGILSIPRDMWVAIPGFKHGKINTAYYLGDLYKLPGGGPGLAAKTVEQFLGVPINYYAQIDFDAFVRFIDEIGGVKINVPEKIVVDPLGDNNTKTLKPGVQTLPGDLALAYARNRYTEGGDFDRARRQQQVILGIRDRILSFDMLPVLISKSDVLYQQLSSGVHTNLSLDQVFKLGVLASQVPDESIHQGVIGSQYVIFGKSPDNLSILIPVPDKIHVLRDEIFTASGAMGPLTPGSLEDKVRAESATVSVQDGTGSGDLSARTAEYLRSLGVNVVSDGQAGEPTSVTTLIDHSGKPYVIKALVETMAISKFKVISNIEPNSTVDVELILGNDWANKNPLP